MKFTVDDRKYRKRRKTERLDKAYRLQLNIWGAKTVKHILKNLRGKILKVGTGHLRRSIAYKDKSKKGVSSVTVGAGVAGRRAPKYAEIHETGLPIITPKKAKALTIPLPGVKGVAANYPDAFLIKSKAGNTLLVEPKGKEGIRPLFVLKKSVKMPARRWLSRSRAEMKPELLRLLKPAEIIRVMAKMR